MLIRYVTLWPLPLTSQTWKFVVYIKRQVIKACTKFQRNQAIPVELLIIWRIFAHVMSRCDLDLWPLDLERLQHFGCLGCHAFKLCTKFERNRIIPPPSYRRRLRTFSPCKFRGGTRLTNGRGAWIQLHKTWWGHRAIMLTEEVCFSVRISCCIFKRERLKVELCWKRCQILHFLTPCEN